MQAKIFSVTRWSIFTDPHSGTQTVEVVARSYREALERSGLKTPSALFSVTLRHGATVRYQVSEKGRAMEMAFYGTHKEVAR